jgi:hypothetical protein
MNDERFGRAAIGAAMMSILAACAGSGATQPMQRYVPVSRSVEPLGALELDNKRMRLEAFDGEMKLQYAGRMAEVEGSDLSGASVYRVTNGDSYLKRNRSRRELCPAPPRWLAVASRTGAPAWSGEIWVALLTVDDWAKYNPGGSGYCIGGQYIRAPN